MTGRTAVAMQARRERILEQARLLLARADEGLSLRKLADASGVSVPTLYNLIGNRDAILLALVSELIEHIERHLHEHADAHPLALAEAVVVQATAALARDEEFHRAALVAMSQLERSGAHAEERARHHDRCVGMQERAVLGARARGLLRGEVEARTLAEQIFANYRQASAEWASGEIDLAEFRSRALLGVYLHFLADAKDAFRDALLEKIAARGSRVVSGGPDGRRSGRRPQRRRG